MKTKKKLVRGRKGKDAKTAEIADAAEGAVDAGRTFPTRTRAMTCGSGL